MYRRNALLALLLLVSLPAYSHHSQAAYDLKNTVELVGTVKSFEWTNPHSWIVLEVTSEQGDTAEWSVEMGNPRQLFRAGWRPGTLKPGDQIKLTINPTKNGSRGGQFFAAEYVNGDLIETAGDE